MGRRCHSFTRRDPPPSAAGREWTSERELENELIGKTAGQKQIHPYRRNGVLIRSYGAAVPTRLVQHGAHVDFMAVGEDADAGAAGWKQSWKRWRWT